MTAKRKPRNVRSAERQGWTVVTLDRETFISHNVSFLGITIWTDRNAKGRYINNFEKRQFAFELEKDAAWFGLKWL